eukprot:4911546-Prorocentrum_lima.AAC.1
MTSSLVGSEMCIRDRDARTHGRTDARTHGRTHARTHYRLCGHFGSSSTSVSYTHLTLPTICSV